MRRILSFTTYLLAVFMFVSCTSEKKDVQTQPEEIKRPNIIYILADDLGYGDLSCFGQDKFFTPNIDRMAEEGMVFTQHYSGSTVCAPSRATLFTGLHTGHNPVRGNKGMKGGGIPIPDSIPMLSEMFHNAGYKVGVFGKWGIGYPGSESSPENRNVDEWYGYNSQGLAHNYYPEYLWHNAEKVYLEGNANRGTEQYSFDLIHDQALKFLGEVKDEPFFIFLPYTVPHAELLVPEDSIFEHFKGMFPETPFVGYDEGEKYRKGPYGSQEFPHAAFAAMVTRFDLAVGDILNKLDEYGIADNTLVIFTSDNGTHLEGGADPDFFNSNGPFRGYKRDLYEGGIRVPTLAWWPGTIEGGSSSDHISAFWDMYPTFAEMVGGEVPEGIDGISMLASLKGEGTQKKHSRLYWEFHELDGRVAMREGDWKAVIYDVTGNPDAPVELYNLAMDPGETQNVADENPEIVARMHTLIKAERTSHPIWDF
jgi:arylsulfatase A